MDEDKKEDKVCCACGEKIEKGEEVELRGLVYCPECADRILDSWYGKRSY